MSNNKFQLIDFSKENEMAVYWSYPRALFIDKRLNHTEKNLYMAICGLSVQKGFCWASNKFLTDELDISEKTLQKYLNTLIEFGYIKRHIFKENMITRRILEPIIVVTKEYEKYIEQLNDSRELHTSTTEKSSVLDTEESSVVDTEGSSAYNNTITFNNTNINKAIGGTPKKKKKIVEFLEPTLEEFISFAKEKEPLIDVNDVRYKYLSWKENNWHTGKDRKITNWKTTLINTLKYLNKIQEPKQQQEDPFRSEMDRRLQRVREKKEQEKLKNQNV